MKWFRRGMLVVLVGSLQLLMSPSSSAQDPEVKSPESRAADLRASLVEDLIAAQQMAEFGRQFKAPESLIAAGSMLLKIDALSKGKLRDISEAPRDENGKEIKEEKVVSKDLKLLAKDYFDAASVMTATGKNSAAVEALIKEAKERKYVDPDIKERGAVLGPQRITRVLAPGATHVWLFTFQADQPAAVGLQSNGASRMRFTIEGPQGNSLFNVVGTWASYKWTPRVRGQYRFRIHNVGNSPVTYTFLTN